MYLNKKISKNNLKKEPLYIVENLFECIDKIFLINDKIYKTVIFGGKICVIQGQRKSLKFTVQNVFKQLHLLQICL